WRTGKGLHIVVPQAVVLLRLFQEFVQDLAWIYHRPSGPKPPPRYPKFLEKESPFLKRLPLPLHLQHLRWQAQYLHFLQHAAPGAGRESHPSEGKRILSDSRLQNLTVFLEVLHV